MTARRLGGDCGQVGGIEAIPFGLLVFVVGTLLIANAWAVIDAKFATDAAARQAARTFVEGSETTSALQDAEAAAAAALEGHGRDAARATIRTIGSPQLVRCERATFEVTYQVPAVSLPFIGGYGDGPFEVRSSHSEVVDPFRSGLDGRAEDCV